MNRAVKEKLSKSTVDFERLVKLKLMESKFIEGKIISIESATIEKYKTLYQVFDILAGIDAWVINTPKGIQGLASRIQWVSRIKWNIYDYKTFTTRFKLLSGNETEYHKRLRALETGEYLYPHYTVQAYITEPKTGDLLGMAVAKTLHIFEMIKADMCWEKINPQDGTIFKCVSWGEMHKYHPIEIFEI